MLKDAANSEGGRVDSDSLAVNLSTWPLPLDLLL